MALTRVKVWVAGEVLTASDLNSEFNNILNNAQSLISPATGNFDLDGNQLILDSDGDYNFLTTSDDVLALRLSTTSLFVWDGSVASAVNGLKFVASAAGVRARIESQGTSTDIDLDLVPKGTGVLRLKNTAFGTVFSRDTGTGTTNVPLVSDILGKKTFVVSIPGMDLDTVGFPDMSGFVQPGGSATPGYSALDFDPTTSQVALFDVPMPADYDGGSPEWSVIWTANSSSTNGVNWIIALKKLVNGGGINTTFSTSGNVTDAHCGTAHGDNFSDYFSAGAGGAATAGQVHFFAELLRNPADAGDTLAVDARGIKLRCRYTTAALNDN